MWTIIIILFLLTNIEHKFSSKKSNFAKYFSLFLLTNIEREFSPVTVKKIKILPKFGEFAFKVISR